MGRSISGCALHTKPVLAQSGKRNGGHSCYVAKATSQSSIAHPTIGGKYDNAAIFGHDVDCSTNCVAGSGGCSRDWLEGIGQGGAVAAGGKDAVKEAGISILQRGGNAADAAAATLLALSITDYGSYAIGAEIPLIIYDARKKQVKVLCGLGGAPLGFWILDSGFWIFCLYQYPASSIQYPGCYNFPQTR